MKNTNATPKPVTNISDISSRHEKRTLSAEILTDCGNCLLATLNFSCVCFLMVNYYGTFTYIIQYDHLNAHFNLIKETKPCIIAKI